MMRRALVVLPIFALVFCFDAPGQAQVRVREHGKKKRGNGHSVKVREHGEKGDGHRRQAPIREGVSVTGFAPQSGRAGSVVTVTGHGFGAPTKVFVGGRPARRISYTPTTLTFSVPARPRDGLVILRHPGVARDIVVGTFELVADATIIRVSPLAGPVGSVVQLQGFGFRAGDQVLLGSKSLSPSTLTPDRITVAVPPGASSGFFVVRRAGSRDARSRSPFRVVVPPPMIAGFAPVFGPPGTLVRLTGTHFSNLDRVFYGRLPLRAVARGPDFIDVAIPVNARRGERLQVRGPRGAVSTAQPFDLVAPPQIARFAPNMGAAGTKVSIFGKNFRPGDEVRLGNVVLRIFTLQANVIVVEIPAGASNAPLTLLRAGAIVATAGRPFLVLVTPSISGFAPMSGPPGTRVVLTGNGLSRNASVFYGAQRLRTQGWREDATGGSLEVVVPASAQSHPFVVRTAGGEASTRMPFDVFRFSVVTGVTPTRGIVGTSVRIRGRNFGATDSFTLAGQALPVTERHSNEVMVTIVAGVASGKIGWTSHGRASQSRFGFAVLNPPEFHSMTPRQGPPGTAVVVSGMRFTRSTQVFFGPRRMQVSNRFLPTELTVIIPATARLPAFLTVANGSERARSAIRFKVLQPPVVRRMRPDRGPAGSTVSLYGAGFSAQSRVFLGKLTAPVVQRIGSRQLVVRVPPGVSGAHPFFVEENGMKAGSLPFTVLGPPAPPPRRPPPPRGKSYVITPASASVGATVTVFGDFRGVSNRQLKVRWSGAPEQRSRTLTTTHATFVVPAGAKTGFCSVNLRNRAVWQGRCTIR